MAEATAAAVPTPSTSSGIRTVILDNGAHAIKVGFAFDAKKIAETKEVPVGDEGEELAATAALPAPKKPDFSNRCISVPNFIAKAKSERRRPFISNQVDDCRDTSGLYLILPFQKGYITSIDIQKTIWDHVFGREGLDLNFSETNLILTEPVFNFQSIQEITCELLFEDYSFNSVCRTTAAHLADYNYVTSNLSLEGNNNYICTLVVDSGHSFTHVIPFLNGQKVTDAIRRIDVGGKALTNQLKEIISYRQIHVLDETYLMNQVKEDLCFVSNDLMADMKVAKTKHPENTIYREYILPDFINNRRGVIRPADEICTKIKNNEQLLRMNNERFAIPEILFNPSDIGIKQMGISDLIHEVIQSFPEPVKPHFYRNILLIGGNANFPGFRDRVYSDVRKLACCDYDVQVTIDANPSTYAWHGGNKLAHDADLAKYTVTREQYLSDGMSAFVRLCDI